MKQLQEMKIFLDNIDKGMQPKIWKNKKRISVLYLPNEYLKDILNKSDELGLRLCMSREPRYGCIDPNTLIRPLIGFANCKYWFEIKNKDGDMKMRYKRKTDIYGDERVLDTRFNDYLSLDEIIRKLNELDEIERGVE